MRDRRRIPRAGREGLTDAEAARPQLPRQTTPTFRPVSPASRTVGTVTPTSVNCAVHCSSQVGRVAGFDAQPEPLPQALLQAEAEGERLVVQVTRIGSRNEIGGPATGRRHAAVEAIRQFDLREADAPEQKQRRIHRRQCARTAADLHRQAVASLPLERPLIRPALAEQIASRRLPDPGQPPVHGGEVKRGIDARAHVEPAPAQRRPIAEERTHPGPPRVGGTLVHDQRPAPRRRNQRIGRGIVDRLPESGLDALHRDEDARRGTLRPEPRPVPEPGAPQGEGTLSRRPAASSSHPGARQRQLSHPVSRQRLPSHPVSRQRHAFTSRVARQRPILDISRARQSHLHISAPGLNPAASARTRTSRGCTGVAACTRTCPCPERRARNR